MGLRGAVVIEIPAGAAAAAAIAASARALHLAAIAGAAHSIKRLPRGAFDLLLCVVASETNCHAVVPAIERPNPHRVGCNCARPERSSRGCDARLSATIEMSGERLRDKKGGRGAGRRCAGGSLTEGVPPFAVKQPQTGTSRARGGSGRGHRRLSRGQARLARVHSERTARAGRPGKSWRRVLPGTPRGVPQVERQNSSREQTAAARAALHVNWRGY